MVFSALFGKRLFGAIIHVITLKSVSLDICFALVCTPLSFIAQELSEIPSGLVTTQTRIDASITLHCCCIHPLLTYLVCLGATETVVKTAAIYWMMLTACIQLPKEENTFYKSF